MTPPTNTHVLRAAGYGDAAHEIEELRRENESLLRFAEESSRERDGLAAENDRLLAALIQCEERLTAEGSGKAETWKVIDAAREIIHGKRLAAIDPAEKEGR